MTDILELADRCEKATGPDDALDGAIWLAVFADEVSRKAYDEGLRLSRAEASFRLSYMSGGFHPTASLDAAMQLVPEGKKWMLQTRFNGYHSEVAISGVDAATPALALCAAALRARAASLTMKEEADG